jgi:hypothetical protein
VATYQEVLMTVDTSSCCSRARSSSVSGGAFATNSATRSSIVIRALRHQAWGAASQSCGSVSLPPDAAVQQQP